MRLLILTTLVLGGCATLLGGCASQMSLTEDQCRGTNWYQRGEQEAIMGMRPQIDLYTHQCSRFGAVPSDKEYMDGWAYGYGEWTRRMSGGRRS